MKDRAFTLIELLSILVILGVITIVGVPTMVTSSKKSKERDYNEFRQTVSNAAEVYVETHQDKYITLKNTNNATATIDINDLISVGLLNSQLTNPNTNQTIFETGGTVTAKNVNGTITYTYP